MRVATAFKAWHMLWLAALLLTACHKTVPMPFSLDEDINRLPTRVNGTSDKVVIKMMRDFKKEGVVKITSIGQDYMISIPSAALFGDQSPQIKWRGFGVLNQVSAFMKQFRKVSVRVISYSSRYVSVKREHALTLARARVVADYLWFQGVDTRLMLTEGAGDTHPISVFGQGSDFSPNSRIEIVFRDAIV